MDKFWITCLKHLYKKAGREAPNRWIKYTTSRHLLKCLLYAMQTIYCYKKISGAFNLISSFKYFSAVSITFTCSKTTYL